MWTVCWRQACTRKEYWVDSLNWPYIVTCKCQNSVSFRLVDGKEENVKIAKIEYRKSVLQCINENQTILLSLKIADHYISQIIQIGQKQLIVGCKNMKVAMSLVHLGNLRLPDNRAGWNSAQPNYTESKVDCFCVLGNIL